MLGPGWMITVYQAYSWIVIYHNLEQISIIRIHIPFLRLLKFRQPEVRARLVPIPILHQHASSINAASRGAQTRKANADAVPLMVIMRGRGVLGQEGVRGDDAADVAEAHLPGRPDGPAVVAAEVEVEPADDDREGRVRAHGDEEQRRVLEVRPRVHGQQDGEAGDGHGGGDEREQEAVLELVGEEGDDEGEDEGAGPRRDAVQLGADLRVPICPDDARGEEGVAVGFDHSRVINFSLKENKRGVSEGFKLSQCVPRLQITFGWRGVSNRKRDLPGTMSPKYMNPPRKNLKSLKQLRTSLKVIRRSRAERPWSFSSRALM